LFIFLGTPQYIYDAATGADYAEFGFSVRKIQKKAQEQYGRVSELGLSYSTSSLLLVYEMVLQEWKNQE